MLIQQNMLDLRLVYTTAALVPAACFLLHVLTPGGFIGSHCLVINVVTLLLCCVHLLLETCKATSSQPGTVLGLFVCGTFVSHVMAILFGAHILSQFWETLSLASLISSLALLPPALLMNNDWHSWVRVFGYCRFESTSEQLVYYTSMATVVGAWLGSLLIPLDWNRPWQVWPIPCSSGALCGNIVGIAVGSVWIHHIPYFRTDFFRTH